MKIAIVDTLGLCYDGNTLRSHGLGGSESAVICIAKELAKLNFEVTVFNNCIDSNYSTPGIYDNVTYIDNSQIKNEYNFNESNDQFDIVIVSRTVLPFLTNSHPFLYKAKKRVLWLHDTFIEGDQFLEDLVINKKIDHIFTLSDWHSSYIMNCDHGKRRNYEVLKSCVFQTRNGAVKYDVDLIKDKNKFIYNASATKGMVPLIEDIWPKIKQNLPDAKLTVVGGYYRFRENATPDAQENTVQKYANDQKLKDLGVTFTGIIPQSEIAKLLGESYMMLYPGAFPETFGISTLESLLYKTPLVTTRFGALEETALDLACYKIDYAIEPNSLFQTIDKKSQVEKFVNEVLKAVNNPYLHQQKQQYCTVVEDIAGWDTVALQWKQFFYSVLGEFLSVDEYRKVSRINEKVQRIFGRVTQSNIKKYSSYGPQRKIVVISPFYNAANYIEKNIRSVATQDYDNYEHILIDDCSIDDSLEIAKSLISNYPKVKILQNFNNRGAIFNQLTSIQEVCNPDDIVILLDGDDWLVNNNTIFHYYNDLYNQGYEFTYGSMWSVADNIPLIAQEYPDKIKENKSYRKHLFNWKIPYTHLRTCLTKYFLNLDEMKFKDKEGKWMKSGHDNPLFYELIEQIDPKKIYCNKEVVCMYNDKNPLNDYKINGVEQNENASKSYNAIETKKILIAIPTNKNIEAETFKSIYDLEIPPGYETTFQMFHGYQIDQIRNLIAEWAKNYDYLFSVDSDIILPKDSLKKMLKADKDVISGLYIQRKPNQQILEVYGLNDVGGVSNIPVHLIEHLDIVEIMACGMGCTLIKSEVIRKMPYPHFYYKSALTMEDTVSEDVFFCLKAREHGFKIWADPSIKCDHIGSTKFSIDSDVEKNIEFVYSQDMLPREHISYLEKMDIRPKIIYDIGSSVLHWQRHAKRIWPNADIYLLDANEDLKKLYSKQNCNWYLGVLTDGDEKIVEFYQDPFNLGGNSYYKENTGAYNEFNKKKRIAYSLDTIVKMNNWEYPDFIKMDIQGAELDVLKGAEKCLEKCSDLILECQHEEYNLGAPKVQEVISYLDSKGFKLVSNFTKTQYDGDYHFRKVVSI